MLKEQLIFFFSKSQYNNNIKQKNVSKYLLYTLNINGEEFANLFIRIFYLNTEYSRIIIEHEKKI